MRQDFIDLFDDYTHGTMGRREFLKRLQLLAGGAAAAATILPLLENNYALAAMVAEDDPGVSTGWASYAGVSGDIRGYLAAPAGAEGDLPAVLVIHENRGLNPHTQDVARRLAKAGFLALAVDMLSPLGGTPEDQDEARTMIRTLDDEATVANLVKGVEFLKGHERGNGKVGAVGFCWGGGKVNQLAAATEYLNAGVAYYGRQVDAAEVSHIKASLLLHYAGEDQRINAGIEAYETALKSNGVEHRIYVYPGVQHAFNNDTNEARYNKEAADLAWGRTLEFFNDKLN